MYYSGRSDLLSDVKAFDACLLAKSDGHAALRNFAEDNVRSCFACFRTRLINLLSNSSSRCPPSATSFNCAPSTSPPFRTSDSPPSVRLLHFPRSTRTVETRIYSRRSSLLARVDSSRSSCRKRPSTKAPRVPSSGIGSRGRSNSSRGTVRVF